MIAKPFRLKTLCLLLLIPMLPVFPLVFAAGLPLGAQPWAHSSLTYRREIQLPADPARSRSNVPVIFDLKQLGPVVLTTLKVDEVTNSPAVACTVAAYAQPSGRDPRAYWVATGSTAAGATRRFLLYYNKASASPAYPFSWRSGSFGSYKVEITGNSSSTFKYNLKGDRLDFMRTGRKVGGVGDPQHAVMYEQNSGFFRCLDTKNNYNFLSGIRYYYAFLGEQFSKAIYFNDAGAERYFDAIKWDRNGPTVAMNVHYSINDEIAHQTEVTHRLFQGQPLLELSLTATPKSGPPLDFCRDIYNSRQFYWNGDVFTPTRHINDLGRDGSLNGENDVKHYLIQADASGRAIGMFSFRPSTKKRVGSSRSLQEYEGLGSEQGSLYLYYAVGKVDELKSLFDSMKRGYPLGEEQMQRYNIVKPAEDAHFITGETISAVIAGPNLGSDLTLRVDYPGGSSQGFKPVSMANGSATFNLGAVGSSSKFGVWKLIANSGGTTRVRSFEVRNPDHPRVLFTASELAQIRTRWTKDTRYKNHIQSNLNAKANSVLAKSAPPATLASGKGPRWYGRDLLNLASALLMDPTQTKYRARMWSDFRTMMAWKQWDPITNNYAYFGGDDVERGEALQALTCVYDWFYSDLSVADRRKYAELFARYADSLIQSGLVLRYSVKPKTYNDIINNRILNQDAALAGLDRLVANEISDLRHAPWRTRLNFNFDCVKRTLSSDGGFNEGESYHALAIWYLFFWTETRRLNGDSSFYSSAWFREMPYYVLYGMMPGRVGNFGGLMPFGNCDPDPFYSLRASLALPGLRGGNRVAQWITENLHYTRVEAYQAIWTDYSITETDPRTLPNWRFFNRRGIFVYRSSWDHNAMYFATKCGEYWGGHEHPDLGTFVIHRNGYPYIAAPHYVAKLNAEDENILLVNPATVDGVVDGKTPRGRNRSGPYAECEGSPYWGKTLRALGSPDYFNVLQDPKPAYEDGANLKSYNREFVGFKDLVILRDKISASAASTWKLMFHGYKTDPQTETGGAYDPDDYPGEQVFQSMASNRVRLYPNKSKSASEWMTILNLSRYNWATSIGPWKLAPASIPGLSSGERSDNDDNAVLTRGGQLSRTLSGATAGSALQVFHFRSDTYGSRAWSSAVADDGVVIYYSATTDDRLKVVWPKGGKMTNVSGAEGLTVTGAMAMRNYENKDFGGRDLTLLRDDSAKGEKTPLLSATTPVTLVSKTAAGAGSAWIACAAASKVTLYCPKAFTTAKFNGTTVAFTGSGTQKTFSIPAAPLGGQLVLTATAASQSGNRAGDWVSYE